MNEHPKCPFTGAPVEIRSTAVPKAGGLVEVPRWFGVVQTPRGGYSTGLFDEKEKLLAFLNGRDGTLPDVPRIVACEPKPEVDKSIENEGKELHETAQEAAAKIIVDSGLRKRFRK